MAAWVDGYLGDYYDCVSEAGYVKLADADLAETVVDLGGHRPRAAPTADGGSVDVSGSSTVEPISACVLTQTGFSGNVEGPGTGDGFKRFCAGETDISDASRADQGRRGRHRAPTPASSTSSSTSPSTAWPS